MILTLALAVGARAAAETEALDGVAVEDFIRLHVLAEDDGEAAQALKLEVRDACLMCTRALLADCPDAETAWETVNDKLGLIELAATLRARVCGWDGGVRAETGVFDFPDRRYGSLVVPAGAYRAVRVVIGEGAGKNWWCVLYPSLCLEGDGEPVRFYSTIWNWLAGLFGGEA